MTPPPGTQPEFSAYSPRQAGHGRVRAGRSNAHRRERVAVGNVGWKGPGAGVRGVAAHSWEGETDGMSDADTHPEPRAKDGQGMSLRLTESAKPPAPEQIESWIGTRPYSLWQRVAEFIAENYPGVFEPEWLFGGEKHGWSLRYKKSKSFCTFIPEKGRFLILIVFGSKERAKVEAIRKALSRGTREAYDEATTYHDGKWLLLDVDDERILADVEQLLVLKRRPKPG